MKAGEKVAAMPDAAVATEARNHSTIEFPYLDLQNSYEIAVAIHTVGGTACEWDQLAAHLKQAAQGGGFRLRMICAKQFGLANYDRGKITLTSLGLRAIDGLQKKAALFDAFLTIPLYKALYDKFRGATLPPIAGLEREMQSLGVATKQADRARQAFARSAKFSGFFDFGSDRLVAPKPAADGSQESVRDESSGTNGDARRERRTAGDDGGNRVIPPAILGLLEGLPPAGSPMSAKRRQVPIAAFTATVG